MSNAVRPQRKTNGQFSHANERLCVCGREKGIHSAEAPFAFEDYSFDDGTGKPKCEGFKLDRKAAKKAVAS